MNNDSKNTPIDKRMNDEVAGSGNAEYAHQAGEGPVVDSDIDPINRLPKEQPGDKDLGKVTQTRDTRVKDSDTFGKWQDGQARHISSELMEEPQQET